MNFIDQASSKGYRVLLMAMKIISAKELENINELLWIADQNYKQRETMYETIFS